jgi:aminoglycoside phosphotransferase (APT) family kinase protein
VDRVARLEACVQDAAAQGRLRELRLRLDSPGEDAMPTGFTHGDLWWGNILVGAARGPIGLVDWDGWSDGDFATSDFLHLTCYRRVLRDGSTWPQAVADWLHGRNIDRIEREGTDRLAGALGLTGNWKTAAGLAYWIREVTAHDDPKLRLDQTWIARTVGALLPDLLEVTRRR